MPATDEDKFEILDAHVHWWDLGNPWYPDLQGVPDASHEVGLGDLGGLRRNYLLPEYRRDSANYRVRKVVHVSATQAPRAYVDETRWLDKMASTSGWPNAIIGALEPSLSLWQLEGDIDAQLESRRFRGLRLLFGVDPAAPRTADILKMLAERNCIFELVTHPPQALEFVRLIERFPSLQVVVEHAGWPTEMDDRAHFAQWREGMAALASLDNVCCKISGLAMTLHSCEVAQLRPWVEHCLAAFGDRRCFFASNFPVDALFGSFDALYDAYRAISAELGPQSQRRLFVDNAERIYRI